MSGASFEIWQDRYSGERYLVGRRFDRPYVVCGPLGPTEDPRRVLEVRGTRRYYEPILTTMQRHPDRYRREYVLDGAGRAAVVEEAVALAG